MRTLHLVVMMKAQYYFGQLTALTWERQTMTRVKNSGFRLGLVRRTPPPPHVDVHVDTF